MVDITLDGRLRRALEILSATDPALAQEILAGVNRQLTTLSLQISKRSLEQIDEVMAQWSSVMRQLVDRTRDLIGRPLPDLPAVAGCLEEMHRTILAEVAEWQEDSRAARSSARDTVTRYLAQTEGAP